MANLEIIASWSGGKDSCLACHEAMERGYKIKYLLNFISKVKIIEGFIRLGFKAVVVSAKAELFDKKFIGREIDHQFLAELKKRKICPCGENGEFHTFVIDGPIFKKGKIEITKSRTILRKGFWPHWFLDIQGWRVKNKWETTKSRTMTYNN